MKSRKNILNNLKYILNKVVDARSEIANASNESAESLSFEFDETDAMSQHQYQTYPTQQTSSSPQINHVIADIEDTIDLFQPDPLPPNVSILTYWESVKEENYELYQIAMAIYSVPPTEVQIERDFSSLGWIFFNRRTRLGHERLEDIMLIYLNKELYEIVSQNQLKDELEKNQIRVK